MSEIQESKIVKGEKIAYLRVSDDSQNLDRQIDMMLKEGIKERYIYKEKISGAVKGDDRAEYRAMKSALRPGDCLLIASLDRLGRDYHDICEEWKELTKVHKVDIRVLDMPILDTTKDKDLLGDLITDLVVKLLGYVAQTEREKIKLRQKQGIESAKKRGKHLGRPKAEMPKGFEEAVRSWRAGEKTAVATYTELGLKKATFYRLAKKVDE